MTRTKRLAPYAHFDGSPCWTKNCSRNQRRTVSSPQSKPRIEAAPTGDIGGTFLFLAATLPADYTQEEYSMAMNNDLTDFVLIRRKGTLPFYHVSYPEYEDGILEEGLIPSGNISDLGKGVYFVEDEPEYNTDMLDYVAEQYSNDPEAKILIVSGKYTGEYLECVKGPNHTSYRVAENGIPAEAIHSTKILTVSEFLGGWI